MAAAKEYSTKDINLALAVYATEAGRRKPVEAHLRAVNVKVPFKRLRTWAYDTHKDRYQQIKDEVEEEIRTTLADDYHRLAKESIDLSENTLERIRGLLTKRDRELAEVEERLEDCKDELKTLEASIDTAQARLAESLEIPNVDALIEEVLGEGGAEKADAETVAELTQLHRRREALTKESDKLWNRRDRLEVGFRDLTKLLHESGVTGGIATDKQAMLTDRPTVRVEHSFPELQRALEAKGIRLAVGQGAPRALPVPIESVPAKGGPDAA